MQGRLGVQQRTPTVHWSSRLVSPPKPVHKSLKQNSAALGGGCSCWRLNSISQAEWLSTGSSGGDGTGSGPPNVPTDELEPDAGGEPEAGPEAILAKHNVDSSSLPADIQDGLRRGVVTAKDIELYLKIASQPLLSWICKLSPFLRERVMGNPRFLLVLAIEEVIGVSAKTAAEFQGRGDEFWNEIQFVASDLALEIIGDFAVVCLLSPKRSFAQRPKAGLAQAISGLPGHAFQVGNFSLTQRLSTILYRGAQFFSVGFVASAIGHSITKYGVEKQQRLAPKQEGETPYKPLAPVLDNSAIWGTFMAVSTNLRYQFVNCIEDRGLEAFVPNAAAKNIISFFLRFSNTYSGGAQWVWFARFAGLQ